jgi:hypothetical protein
MAQQYASQQPQRFKNHIEKIAIVGVRDLNLSYDIQLINNRNRLAVRSANTSSKPCSKRASSKSPPSPVKGVARRCHPA